MSTFRNTVVMCTPPDALCQLSEFGQWSIRGWEYSCCNTFSCQVMKTIALFLHKHVYNWVVKIRNTQR